VQENKFDKQKFFAKAGRIVAYFKPYWGRWIILFIIANFATALSLINPLIVKFLIDVVLVERNIYYLNIIVGVFLSTSILSLLMHVYFTYYYQKLKLNVLFDVRNELFHHLENLDVSFFRDKKLGDILSRLTGDIEGIEKFVSLIFNTFIISTITLVIIFIISATLHLRMTLMAMLAIPGIMFLQHYYAGRIQKRFRVVRERGASFLSYLQERLSVVPLIKLFAQERIELRLEKKKAREVIGANLELALTSSLAGAFTGLVIAATLLFILWYGSSQVIAGALTIGSLIAIYTYIAKLFGPVGTLTSLNLALQTTLVSADRVFEFLDVKPQVCDCEGAKALEKVDGEISFQDISFGYHPEERVLCGINLEIKAGESIGIVGPSGVGKSSLIQFIPRFYDPLAGCVKIDGNDVRQIRLRSLRRHIGMVTQDVVIFNTTLRENILYGRPRASFREVIKAAKLAGIHEYIKSLPKRYNTEVGERGLSLSQGQRQRISLARVFLKDPKIFLLDEATSSLDSESEMRIQNAINHVIKGRTTLIVAHRLTTLQAVDRIVVLSDTELVEQGTFGELMERKGHFFALYTAQFGGFHAFEEKLNYELKRAREQGQNLIILGIRIENLANIMAAIGREKAEEILGQIKRMISHGIREIDFMAQDPHHRDVIYIGMPGVSACEVENMEKKLRAKIPQEFILRFNQIAFDPSCQNVEETIKCCRKTLSR
jgi:ABC-type multidrug transport system fused ATPase/permease subunit